jgi:transposase
MNSSEIERRTNVKCCLKLGKTATKTHEMLIRVYGDAAVSRKAVYKWSERFCGGAESAENEQRSGHPSTSTADENVSKINEIIRVNRTLTIREISNALNISFGSVQLILTKNVNFR